MRKILLTLLIILLLLISVFVAVKGFQIGSLEIWGITSIKEKNEAIDYKNSQLSNLVSITYPNSQNELNTGAQDMQNAKKEYEDKAILVSNSKSYMQTEQYEIEFLWTRLGNFAEDENVKIKIDVVNSSTQGLYDLNFTIVGKYAAVTDFIYDLENDSKLGFKVEDFHMVSAENGVQGTFSCKEININIQTIENTQDEQTNETQDSNTTNTQETNTTNETVQNNVTNEVNTTDETNVINTNVQ